MSTAKDPFDPAYTAAMEHRMSDPAPTRSESGRPRGDWMQTFTGRRFYPLDPRPSDVDIYDVAQGLSHLCRFAGQVDRFYSVAEHSVLLSRAVAPEHALAALLHDAAEAYIVDVPRPLKRHLPDYVAIEDKVLTVIAVALGLHQRTDWSWMRYEIPAEVKAADSRILLDERRALMRNADDRWDVDAFQPLNVGVVGWKPDAARAQFLYRWRQLSRHGA